MLASTVKRFIFIKLFSHSRQIKYLQRHGMKIGKGGDIQNPAKFYDLDFNKISIGNNVTIASSALIIPHDGSLRVLSGTVKRVRGRMGFLGLIKIYDNCFIGANAIILPGVEIGPNSIVAAGAVVTKNIPPDTVYGGNPAKLLCSLDELRKKVETLPKVYSTITNQDDIKGRVVRIHGFKPEEIE